MNPSAVLAFLRRELVATPGRASATFRLTLACVAATIPIMVHRIPLAGIVMIVMFLVTQEDTAATLLGSVGGWVGVTLGLGLALLAWEISLETPWLRICFFAGFLFGGLFLKRTLTMGALGSAIGVPAALTMIVPDLVPPSAEVLTEFVLWVWWCVTLGLAVNAAVQLLLSPGDPLALLRRELDTRLHAVEQSLRLLAGRPAAEPPPAVSLSTLVVAGMSRPLALLKTASLLHPWARGRHERLAAIITLVDRLATAARALELRGPAATEAEAARLSRAAEGCRQMRQAFQQLRRPEPGQWMVLATEPGGTVPPLADIERTLDELVLAVPGSEPGPASRPGLFIPDAFENPEYVRFATKGTISAMICYLAFVGSDYPGSYTSVITCFVVALSTIGASNQKGILRFGGAAVGGLMGLVALVYLLPHIDTIGGFWVVFGAGTAVAAWINFGSPRISYGGYQSGLAFWKAVLQGFGPALSATVVRDRLVGIAFGLVVYGLVEHVLWPVRAWDVLRARLSEALRLLADLARVGTSEGKSVTTAVVDSWHRRISQKMEEVQGLIESSKFERDALDLDALQKRTGNAQVIFVILLSLARHRRDPALSEAVQAKAIEVDGAVAETLDALAANVTQGFERPTPDLQRALHALERSAVRLAELRAGAALTEDASGPLGLYRSLVAVLRQLAPGALATARAS